MGNQKMLTKKLILVLLLININTIYNQENNYEGVVHPHKVIQEYQLQNDPETAFKNWHFLHEKSKDYELESEEAKKRFQNFKENFELIKNHNKNNHSFKLGLNHFADYTLSEFHENFLKKNTLHFKKLEENKAKNKIRPSIMNPNGPLENRPSIMNPNGPLEKEKSKEFYDNFWNSPDE